MVSSDEKAAYGWVHNVNKYWRNAYYYDVADEQYYWCNDSTASPVTQFKLEHLLTGMYDAEFHPTRMGGQPLPDNQDSLFVISFSPNPYVYIPLTTVTLGCDSLSADFAFKVIQHGSDHRMARNPDKQNHDIQNNTSFVVSPNPNQGSFKIIIPKNDSEHCMLRVYDSQDKLILKKEDLNTELFNLDLSECRKGIYFVQVISNNQSSFKKVVIQ
ncbi:MAG: T9SS type A sorting domain-containing protein [Bacteroidetes bacterium]|nr:T9SS type A sorting domain-containing protein [Bacteroidota bacterium]